MSNALFTFMYSVWDDKEIWEIADKPGDYVIALTDLITQQFHVLGYVTKRNKAGEIYFAKYDSLKPPSADGGKYIVRQRENAQIIAFFFIRLFQIMGALLLVVKDISLPVLDTSGKQIIKNTGRAYLNQSDLVLQRFKGKQAGGAEHFPIGIPLGPYEFLRFYLRQISKGSELATKYGIQMDTTKTYKLTNNLYFQYDNPSGQSYTTKDIPKQKFLLITKRGEESRPSLQGQEVIITNLFPSSLSGYIAPSDQSLRSSPAKQLERYHNPVTFELRTKSRTPQLATVGRTVSEATKESYIDGVEYRFDSGTSIDTLTVQLDAKKDFAKILESIVLIAVRANNQDNTIKTFYKDEKEETKQTGPSQIGKLPEVIKNPVINDLYQFLRNKKESNQPHCISRALQLIDRSSIEKVSSVAAKSSICKFAVADETGPISMATYKPLRSVAQLFGKVNPADFAASQKVLSAFVGQESKGDPLGSANLGEKEKNETGDLSGALARLATAFEFQYNTPLKSFEEISLKRPDECKTTEEMTIEHQETIRGLRDIAQQLLAYQINRTIEISKFLKTIFNIKQNPDRSWKVEGPKTEVLLGGFMVLDQLTDHARELLVDYYSGCEELYQKGVNIWRESPGVAEEKPKANAVVPQANAVVPQANAPKVNAPKVNAPKVNAVAPKVNAPKLL